MLHFLELEHWNARVSFCVMPKHTLFLFSYCRNEQEGSSFQTLQKRGGNLLREYGLSHEGLRPLFCSRVVIFSGVQND